MKSMMRLSVLASAALLTVGATSSALAQGAPQAPNMTFFVTSAPIGKGGDLGGLEGADRHCQQLATTVGAGSKTWRAYLSTSGMTPVNARDRIGKGPWQNSKGTVIATSVEDLHGAGTKMGGENSLTERGTRISGFGMTPNWHDALTGSDMEGKAYPGNMNLTCGNWTSSGPGVAQLGHIDRTGGADTVYQHSWASAHTSRACSQPDLIATGGNGLFYCFAAQ
jgi:hypothetical protein